MLAKLIRKIEFHFAGKRGAKGQIFPFLVLIMVIMIVAVMAFVNVAQVNTRKLSTMNAADAGALAGAAQLASTANSIADVNSGKWGLYDTYEKTFLWTASLPLMVFATRARFGLYTAAAISNLLRYINLLAAGISGVQQSAAQAVTTAFGNMPIEEVQTRRGSVTGPQRVPSPFTKWLHDKNFYSSDTTQEYTYSWTSHYYNITEDKEMPSSQKDWVKVKVRKPEDNSFLLHPAPLVPQITVYYMYLPCECYGYVCDLCEAVRGSIVEPAREDLQTQPETASYILLGVFSTAAVHALLAEVPVAGITELLAQMYVSIAALSYMMMPIDLATTCCVGAWTMMFYYLPLPFIASMDDNNAEIAVEVTRFSPTRDLGLWQFRQRKITSGARARIRDGSVWNANYRVEVAEVWDGERL